MCKASAEARPAKFASCQIAEKAINLTSIRTPAEGRKSFNAITTKKESHAFLCLRHPLSLSLSLNEKCNQPHSILTIRQQINS